MPMAGEYTNKTESLRPIAGLMMRGQHRPFHRQFRSQVRGCLLFQEHSKLPKTLRHASQLGSQTAPEPDVVLDGLSQGLIGCLLAMEAQWNEATSDPLWRRFEWCPVVDAATDHRSHPGMRHY